MTDKPSYVYVTYIEATPEAVWHALTDADLTGAYWGHRNVSDWKVGSTWIHERLDGSGNDGGGGVEEADPSCLGADSRSSPRRRRPGSPSPSSPTAPSSV